MRVLAQADGFDGANEVVDFDEVSFAKGLVDADGERAEQVLECLLCGEGEGQTTDTETGEQARDRIAERGDHGDDGDDDGNYLHDPSAERQQRTRTWSGQSEGRVLQAYDSDVDDAEQTMEERQQQARPKRDFDDAPHRLRQGERGKDDPNRNEAPKQRERTAHPLEDLVIDGQRRLLRQAQEKAVQQTPKGESEHRRESHEQRRRNPFGPKKPHRTVTEQRRGRKLQQATGQGMDEGSVDSLHRLTAEDPMVAHRVLNPAKHDVVRVTSVAPKHKGADDVCVDAAVVEISFGAGGRPRDIESELLPQQQPQSTSTPPAGNVVRAVDVVRSRVERAAVDRLKEGKKRRSR